MKRKKWMCMLIVAVAVLLAASCGKEEEKDNKDLIGSGTKVDPEKTVVTIYGIQPLENFTKAVEEKFPDIQIVRYVYNGNYQGEEFKARIQSKDTCDIMMVKAGRVPLLDPSGSLMDLSTESFPANFNKNALLQNEDGKIYFVPGPLSFNAYIYNKTLFAENGWKVPESYDELLSLAETIDATGIRGNELALGYKDMPAYLLCVRIALDYMTTVEGQTWHNKFLSGKTTSLEPLEDALAEYQRQINTGMIRTSDLSAKAEENRELLKDRQMAMTSGEIDLLRKLNEAGTDEYGFFPHFGTADDQGWLLSLGYYFGAGKHLEEPENKEKLEAVEKILEYISTDEGQQVLIKDSIGILSASKTAAIPEDEAFDGIRTQMEQGSYIMRPVLGKLLPVLQPEMAEYVKGEITSEEIMADCRELMEKEDGTEESLGTATADFSLMETALFKADVLREAMGTDIALMGAAEVNDYIPVQGVQAKLYKGPVTEDDINRTAQRNVTFPAYCCRAQIKGEELLKILESGSVSAFEQETEDKRFHPYAVSGMSLTYDLDAEQGKRTTEVKMADGSSIDSEKTYSVAYLEDVIGQDQVTEPEMTEKLLTEMMAEKVKNDETITPDKKSVSFK